jgi:hypothetical protein
VRGAIRAVAAQEAEKAAQAKREAEEKADAEALRIKLAE